MTSPDPAALIRALRRPGDEAQLTQALQGALGADRGAAAAFVAAVTGLPLATIPALACRAEETVEDGRLDLRFSGDDLDVIVELKLYASYGRDQLGRYLRALRPLPQAFLVAVTRDVPTYGEAHLSDPRWLGSRRWRTLLPDLRALPFSEDALRVQWLAFLDVLAEEGSFGFMQPDVELFETWPRIRRAGRHAEEFLVALQMPLLEALNAVLASRGTAADFYRKKRGLGGPVVSKSWNGVVDIPFRVPADGHVSVRAGLFAYNPPVRFYVSPHHGRRLSARKNALPKPGRAAVDELIAGGRFREYDLHAFLELTPDRLRSPSLEEEVVGWAHDRFAELCASGLLELQHTLGRGSRPEEAPEEDEPEQASGP